MSLPLNLLIEEKPWKVLIRREENNDFICFRITTWTHSALHYFIQRNRTFEASAELITNFLNFQFIPKVINKLSVLVECLGKSSRQTFWDKCFLLVILIEYFRVIESSNDLEDNIKEDFLPEELQNSNILIRQDSRGCFVKIFNLVIRRELETFSRRLVRKLQDIHLWNV